MSHRLRCALGCHGQQSRTNDHLRVVSSSLQEGVDLLDSVALLSLCWGLETIRLTQTQRLTMDSVRRSMVSRIEQMHRRPQEQELELLKRRERVATPVIKKQARARWSQIARYTHLTFTGHATRLPEAYMVRGVMRWRSSAWWEECKKTVPAEPRTQLRRRPCDSGILFPSEMTIIIPCRKLQANS